jgi:hypothetical protein
LGNADVKGVIFGAVCHQVIDRDNRTTNQKIKVRNNHFKGAKCGM